MADACIHGFAPGSCLICQTLDAGTGKQAPRREGREGRERREGTEGRAPRAATARRKAQLTAAPGGALAVPQSGPRVVPPEAPAERSSISLRLFGVAVAVIAVMILAWTLLHVVFAVLHLLELLGIALLAGYIGWRAGVYHGRRTADHR